MEEIREQPVKEPTNVSIETEGESVVSETGSQIDTARQASQPEQQGEYGKFKSLEALLNAYSSLEAEFTKKCQRLSQLEKEKTEVSGGENIDDKLTKFLSKNEEAGSYAEELKEIVSSEAETGEFESAMAKLVLNRVAQNKLDDPMVNRYILSSDEIQNKVIENYLNALKEQKPPVVISSQKGERVSSVKPDTPTSLKEAKKLVEKMFS